MSRSPERARLGALIRTRRKALRISQEAMARRVGLTLAGYRPWEYGERDLKSEDLPLWAEALELSRAELGTQLGLGGPSVRTRYAAEIEELISAAPDDEAAADLLQALRAMARIIERRPSPGG
jgi:transcriptional regulator with XRE-family HTH domain